MPLPQGYTVKKKTLPKFHPIPTDRYQVQITDITLKENVPNPFSGKDEDKLSFEFTVLDKKNFDYVDDANEQQIEPVRGRKLWKDMTPSMSPASKRTKASWLYKIICAVEKKEMGDNIPDLEPNDLIGKQLIAMVEETDKGYNNILGFSGAKADLDPIPVKEESEDEASQPDETQEAIAAQVDPGFEKEPEEEPKPVEPQAPAGGVKKNPETE